jgi:hypothetical protein
MIRIRIGKRNQSFSPLELSESGKLTRMTAVAA